MDAKTTGIIAYLTWVGWLIAFFAGEKEDSFAKFHLNQALVLLLGSLIVSFISPIPIIGWLVGIVAGIAMFVFWIIGFIGACQGEEKPVPLIGGIQILK